MESSSHHLYRSSVALERASNAYSAQAPMCSGAGLLGGPAWPYYTGLCRFLLYWVGWDGFLTDWKHMFEVFDICATERRLQVSTFCPQDRTFTALDLPRLHDVAPG